MSEIGRRRLTEKGTNKEGEKQCYQKKKKSDDHRESSIEADARGEDKMA